MDGQRPVTKRDYKGFMVYFRSDMMTSIDRFGCIIVIKTNRKNLVKHELVAVPNNMGMGLLYSLHLNLGHPTTDQLHQAVDTRFFTQDLTRFCKDVTESYTPCTSVKSIPKEIH